ncbi:hypothetical protein DFR24_0678 [Panacagrimonas perspica]|uniref:Uncharacterized protein n=1 Tax=Panacagrimonas perspica TaxID=381431 RepID=A0A4R7PB69_9GAMM|nr:hypothetical protein [Panacagrimonas perspica]TDU31314.1 hypothetical protein DFR24_0678 [Panacagrimonas perspica]THD02655.1 hypothetical protein B1810_14020 [Panacagrimonas perspica]
MNDELRDQLRAAAARREPALLCRETVAALGLNSDNVVLDVEAGLIYFELDGGSWSVSRVSAEGLAALGMKVH